MGLRFGQYSVSDSAYYNRCIRALSIRPSVRLSVCHIRAAKAVGWNEMPFGRDTSVAPK